MSLKSIDCYSILCKNKNKTFIKEFRVEARIRQAVEEERAEQAERFNRAQQVLLIIRSSGYHQVFGGLLLPPNSHFSINKRAKHFSTKGGARSFHRRIQNCNFSTLPEALSFLPL